MSFADDIAEKRKETASVKASQASHQESLSAVTESGKGVVSATSKLAKSTDIGEVIKQLQQLQLDTLIANQSRKAESTKPTIILTDQTDLGDRLTKLADNIADSVAKLDSSKANSEQLAALKGLQSSIQEYAKAVTDNGNGSVKASRELLTAIKAIKVAPVVNVPEPKVTIQPQKLDFTPLQNTIREYFTTPDVEKIDLECYRAQDITDSGDMQYVGFVNPDGGWYIIENDVKANSLRYVFGAASYTKAFQNAAQYRYALLNEAIDALQT